MSIDLYTYTNPGSRQLNEDSFGVVNSGGRCGAILCDGLGGHDKGEVASQTAVKLFVDAFTNMSIITKENIAATMNGVNDSLLEMQKQKLELFGMRTTAVGCIFGNNQVNYFNCGDSRFYYFSAGKMVAMSKDHSVSQMSVDMGEMTFGDIRFDADRNRLLKVLGENAAGDVGTVYPPINCRVGDAFLLCSDGFWEYVLEEEMEIDLSKSKTAKEWIEYMLVRLLIKFGNDNDNFTVVGGIIK